MAEKLYYNIGVNWGDTFAGVEELAKKFQRNRVLTEKLKSELSTYKKQLKDLQKSEELSTEAGKQKYNQLIANITQAEQQLRKAKASQRDLNKEFEALDFPDDSMKKYRAEIVRLQKDLDLMSKAHPDYPKLKKKVADMRGEMQKFDKSINDGRTSVGLYEKELGKAFRGVGKEIANVVGIASGLYLIRDAGAFAINTFKEFEQQVATLGAISGATTNELSMLEEEAKRLGKTTQFTASQVAELQTNFARIGLDPTSIKNATAATLDLAIATGEDLAGASEVVAATLGGYQLSAEETKRVTDVMASSFNNSALNLEKFKESTKLVAPVAKAAGVDIETTTAALGALANAGLDGSIAGTGMRRILSEMSSEGSKLSKFLGYTVNSSEDFQRALNDLSKAGIDNSKSIELVGRNAQSTFTVLANSGGTVAELTEKFNAADEAFGEFSGAADEAARKVENTLQGDLLKLQSAIEGAAIEFVEMGDGSIRTFIQGLTSAIPVVQQNINIILSVTGVLALWITRLKIIKTLKKEDAVLTMTLNILQKGYATATKLLTRQITLQSVAQDAANRGTARGAFLAKSISAAQAIYSTILGVLTGKVKIATVAQQAFNLILSANPIGIIVVAVAALAYGLVELNNRSETAHKIFVAVGDIFSAIWGVIQDLISGVITLSNTFVDSVGDIIRQNKFLSDSFNFIRKNVGIVVGFIKKAFGELPAILAGVTSVINQVGVNVNNFFEKMQLRLQIAFKQLEKYTTLDGEARGAIDAEIEKLRTQKKDLEKEGKTLGEAFQDGFKKAKANDVKQKVSVTTSTTDKTTTTNNVTDDKNKSLEEAKRKAEERVKIAKAATKQIQDLEIAAIKDGTEKQIAQLKLKAQREIEQIKATGEQKAKLELLINQNLQTAIDEVEAKAAEAKRQKDLEAEAIAFEEKKALLLERKQQDLIDESTFQNELLQLQLDKTTNELALQEEGSKEYIALRQTLAEQLMQQDETVKQAQIENLQQQLDSELESNTAKTEAKKRLLQEQFLDEKITKEQYDLEIQELERQNVESQLNIRVEALNRELETVELSAERRKEILGELSDINNQFYENKVNQAIETARKEQEVEKEKAQALQSIQQQGFDFAKGLSDLILAVELKNTGDNEEAQLKARRKAAQREKAISSFQAILNTAAATTKALASAPAPLNFILAGLVAAKGAVEVGLIAAQPLPQMARGGFNQGVERGATDKGGYYPNFRPHSQGGTVVEMAAYEMAVTPNAGKNRRARSLVSNINSMFGGVSYPDTESLPDSVRQPLQNYLGIGQFTLPRHRQPVMFNARIPKLQAGGINTGGNTAINNDFIKQVQESNRLLREQIEVSKQSRMVQIDELNETARRQQQFQDFGRA